MVLNILKAKIQLFNLVKMELLLYTRCSILNHLFKPSRMNYRVLHIYLPPFWWLAISKPVDPEKSYIPLWKAVTSGCLKKLLNWKQIYDEKLQMSFSKSGRTLFSSFNFEDSLFLSKLTQERVIYLFRKPRIVVHETSFEIGGKPVMEGSRRVLVKLLLLQ